MNVPRRPRDGPLQVINMSHRPGTRPSGASSVMEPERFHQRNSCSACLSPSVSKTPQGRQAAFQRAIPRAVLLPESFRGRCSFGASIKPVSPAGVIWFLVACHMATGLMIRCLYAESTSATSPYTKVKTVIPHPGRFCRRPHRAGSRLELPLAEPGKKRREQWKNSPQDCHWGW